MVLIIDLRDNTVVDSVTLNEFKEVYLKNFLNGRMFQADIMVVGYKS